MDLINQIRGQMNAAMVAEASKKKKGRKRKGKERKRVPKEPIEYPKPIKIPKRRPGHLYTFGRNHWGQLGLQDENLSSLILAYPKEVEFFKGTPIKMVACGEKHTLVLDTEGVVWSFGSNEEKALGRITTSTKDEMEPTPVEIPSRVKQISAGDTHSAALTEEGHVWAWGCYKNHNGTKRYGVDSYLPDEEDSEFCVKPWCITTQLQDEADVEDVRIVKIVSGAHHIVMMGDDFRMYTCGAWDLGQLGRAQGGRKRYTRSDGDRNVDLLLSDKEFALKPRMVRVGNKYNVKNVWAGKYATYCLAGKTGYIYVCGDNRFSQLGVDPIVTRLVNKTILFDPTKTNSFNAPPFDKMRFRQFVGGTDYTVALTETGEVFTLGNPADGQLGLMEIRTAQETGYHGIGFVPRRIEGLRTCACVLLASGKNVNFALTSDGELYSWGVGREGILLNPPGDNETTRDRPLAQRCNQIWGKMEIERMSVGGQHVGLVMCEKRDKEKVAVKKYIV